MAESILDPAIKSPNDLSLLSQCTVDEMSSDDDSIIPVNSERALGMKHQLKT